MPKETQTVEYLGYKIWPREQPTWPEKDRYGFWVSKGGINPMPGACWFQTVDEAREGIRMLELAKGDAEIFWLLMENGGLTSTVYKDHEVITHIHACPGTKVIGDTYTLSGCVKMDSPHCLTPKQALALAMMLREAAEFALGGSIYGLRNAAGYAVEAPYGK
jgi:hypothetical protein